MLLKTDERQVDRVVTTDELLVRADQLRAHYAQIPTMAAAQTTGALFTAWVLWDVVDRRYLLIGIGLLVLLSAARLLIQRGYFRQEGTDASALHWRVLAVGGSLISGCIWGAAAPLLYPPQQLEYRVFLVVLMTMLPVIPVAALAAYLPAFYAYALPCLGPFIFTLALRDNRPEHMAALLLAMMLAAMLVFAHRYSRSLGDAIRLRLQLAGKSDALQQAVEHKTRFIATASHDLRQPVHAMGLFLEVLRRDGEQAALRDESIGHLEASQRNLRAMLGNMLDLSKLDAAVVQPRRRDFAIGTLLQRLVVEFAPLAARKQLGLRCRPSALHLHTDPALLERIVRNLLSNALRYTERGTVLLVCRRHGATARLQVIDTGVGIAADQHAAVFEAFDRSGRATRLDSEGLGLGLAIVQQMAGLLGHPLQLSSVVGRGSAFSVDVPLATAAPTLADGEAAGAGAEAPPMPPARVLILDDDEAVCAGTSRLVEQWGHRAIVCCSLEEALAATGPDSPTPDVLLADYRLAGGHDGLAAVAEIQRRLPHPLAVILITGDTAPQRIRVAYAAGHFLLHKPVDPQRLRACMAEAWVAGQGARTNRASANGR